MTIATTEQHDCKGAHDKKKHENLFNPVAHLSIEKRQNAWFMTFDDRSALQVSRCPLCGTTLEV